MRPLLHPSLVNGRFGDPALFVTTLHARGALLFDLGDLSALSARDLLRVTHVFVSHTHIDHFIGFDALLRVCVGRDKTIRMVGPTGFIARVHHKLQAYDWDLVDRYETDLIFEVMELDRSGDAREARLRFKERFGCCDARERRIENGLVAQEPGFTVSAAVLDHHGPCLGFAVAEPVHVNVWKSRLEQRGLVPGAWLQPLKQAISEGLGDEHLVALPDLHTVPLGELRELVTISQGQKIAYVTDVADTPVNRSAIIALADRADTLFIEARFAAADRDAAAHRAHLTTDAAGAIARAAAVRRVEPFHFSPRYDGLEPMMIDEVQAAFEQ